jgi:hypothetical protein
MIAALLFVLAAEVDPMGQYLADLEKAGVLREDTQPASLDRIRETLVAAEDDLVTGNPQIATTRLFSVVESPRFRHLLVRARVPERRVHARAIAGARRGVRVGRALSPARAGARAQGAVLRARVPDDGGHRARDARAGGGACHVR